MKLGQCKSELRRQLRLRRDALANGELERLSDSIVRHVMSLPAYRRARTRLLFRSFGSEVLTDRLIEDTIRSRARLLLPRVKGPEEALALHEVCDPARELEPGWQGIEEPRSDICPERSVYDPDFVLVPGLGFDREGGRLGYGGGYFDYILNLRSDLVETGAAVAVAFSLQIVGEVPVESWDQRVPVIVTEDGVIETRKREAD